MRIVIGADHRGYELKLFLTKNNSRFIKQIEWFDVGAFDNNRSDYPLFAHALCKQIVNKENALGVLLCATGVGMAIVANRYPGVYAAVVWNEVVARLAREDDHCNVLVLPVDFIDNTTAIALVNSWLEAEPKAGCYQQRLELIDAR